MRIRRLLTATAVFVLVTATVSSQILPEILMLDDSKSHTFPHLLGTAGDSDPVSFLDPDSGSSLWFFRINGNIISPVDEGWVVRKVDSVGGSGYSVSSRSIDFVWVLTLTSDKRHGRITCTVSNNASEKATIQPVLLADTWLGEDNGIPFEFADGSFPREETVISRSEIPDWIKTTRNSSTPDLTLLFDGKIATRPETIILANWRRLRENIDHPISEEGRSFDYLPFSENDSAIYISYEEEQVSPGESYSFTLLVGLDEHTPDPGDFDTADAPEIDTEQENLRLREYTIRLRLDEVSRFLDQLDDILENGPGPGKPTMAEMEERAAEMEQLQREYENL